MKYDICVVGLGYIGLPTASIFATHGKRVYGLEVNPEVVKTVNAGKIHIVEADLDVLVRAAVQSGNLVAGTEAVEADCFILAVPTPFQRGSSQVPAPDVSYIERACRTIAARVRPGNLVILESTSPVGTTEKVRDWILDERRKVGASPRKPATADLLFAHCPERVLPGQLLQELVTNDRIVGGLTPAATTAARRLYETFCTGEILTTDARTAELAKLAENAYRDVNIAFANELSLICAELKLNVWELIKLANHHPRVKILQPGPGVGGHCIAVDPWFIVDAAPRCTPLIRAARGVNDGKPRHVVAQVKAAAARHRAPVIACLGLAFKANIDDLRESPALEIVRELAAEKVGRLLVVEPHITTLPPVLARGGRVELVRLPEALRAADIVVVLVNHRPFLVVKKSALAGKTVIDTRGIWS